MTNGKKEKITANGMYEIFADFVKNHFCHLRERVDNIYKWVIGGFIALVLNLLGVIGAILLLLLKK